MACRSNAGRRGFSALVAGPRSYLAPSEPPLRMRTFATSTDGAIPSASSSSASPAAQIHERNQAASDITSATDTLSTYLLLSRPPTVQRAPTPFEAAYYAYNSKISRTLAQPFVRELYFKKGSATETSFDKDERERERRMKAGGPPLARHLDTKGAADAGDQASKASAAHSPSSGSSSGDSEADMYRTVPRTTKADLSGDTSSLERSLDRTLYLVVRGGAAGKDWTLPFSEVHKRNGGPLHKEAPQALHQLLGKDMDVWMVTNVPVGVTNATADAKKGYIMRAHILAGRPSKNVKGVESAWLTSDELQQHLPKPFFDDVRDLLSM